LKILHTADLHLNTTNPERWEALDQLVTLAVREQVDLFLVAGDLFDREIEAETLRTKLRAALGHKDLTTVILPGNHDYQSYRSGLYFGENVYVINSWAEPLNFGTTSIWGLPFEKIEGERLAGRLREMGSLMDKRRQNILLFHGELLDAFYSTKDVGDEGPKRYMPVHLSYFSPLPVEYVLAGHFHTSYKGWEIGEDSLFIYPGSPVSVTGRETGRRMANLIDDDKRPLEIALDTFHYEDLTVQLDPFNAEDPLLLIEKRLQQIHPAAKILLTVKGLYDGSRLGLTENELAEGIKRVAGEKLAGEVVENYTDVRHVLEDDLFKTFLDKLEQEADHSLDQAQIKELAIKAFRVVKACS
jgi:DNA repair protein SbcD/Mre11